MMLLEATVRWRDGTARVERHERADAFGRDRMDRWALARLADPVVASIEVRRSARFARADRLAR